MFLKGTVSVSWHCRTHSPLFTCGEACGQMGDSVCVCVCVTPARCESLASGDVICLNKLSGASVLWGIITRRTLNYLSPLAVLWRLHDGPSMFHGRWHFRNLSSNRAFVVCDTAGFLKRCITFHKNTTLHLPATPWTFTQRCVQVSAEDKSITCSDTKTLGV